MARRRIISWNFRTKFISKHWLRRHKKKWEKRERKGGKWQRNVNLYFFMRNILFFVCNKVNAKNSYILKVKFICRKNNCKQRSSFVDRRPNGEQSTEQMWNWTKAEKFEYFVLFGSKRQKHKAKSWMARKKRSDETHNIAERMNLFFKIFLARCSLLFLNAFNWFFRVHFSRFWMPPVI